MFKKILSVIIIAPMLSAYLPGQQIKSEDPVSRTWPYEASSELYGFHQIFPNLIEPEGNPPPSTGMDASLKTRGAHQENTLDAGDPPLIENPLTGLPVKDPANLMLPPALVSITNWPTTARPQAGLSFSPLVYEMYIGEGMSRFLAVFYGDYPEVRTLEDSTSTGRATPDNQASVGPIRSGRLPYEHLRKQLNGFLIMASAYKGVAANLGGYTNIFGNDDSNINASMLDVTRLEEIAAANKPSLTELNLSGMTFDPAIPSGGDEANRLWFMYNIYNQIDWRYNNATQSYHRWQDNADGENFIEATDRLTGETLTFENVIILFASHRACTETAFDVDLLYMDRQPALLFRDGKMYPIFWTSKSGDYEKTSGKLRPIRFVDDIGNPFPLHPGQTWIHLVPLKTPYWETDDTRTLFSLLNHKKSGTGNWAIRFDKSFMLDDPTVCDAIRN